MKCTRSCTEICKLNNAKLIRLSVAGISFSLHRWRNPELFNCVAKNSLHNRSRVSADCLHLPLFKLQQKKNGPKRQPRYAIKTQGYDRRGRCYSASQWKIKSKKIDQWVLQ